MDKALIMLKNNILVLAFLVLLCGCASDKPVLRGVDGNEIPPAFANFPDVPFPEKAYVDLDQTKALGSGESWIGSLAFDCPYNASRIYDFYVSEMPKLKWIEVATVRARISQMTYVRGNRAIQILIESDGSDDSCVTLTAIPNQSGIGR